MIEHVHDPEEFVGSLANLIVEGGSVIVTGLGCEGFDVQVLWDKSKAVHDFLSVEGFENVFRRAGFRLVEMITPGKLDFDIVKNRLAQNPDLNPGLARFLAAVVKRSEQAVEDFQAFLRKYALSSHIWVIARK